MLTRVANRARVDTSLTAIARASSEHNEQQVLAARALENERRVTVVRVVALLMMGLSQGGIGALTGERNEDGVWRLVAIVVYAAYALGALYGVRRSGPSIARARWMPLIGTTFDAGFVLAMVVCDRLYANSAVEQSVVLLALIISFSILRYGEASLWYATVLAIAVLAAAMAGAGTFTWPSFTFVSFVYVAIALLLWTTRRAVRIAFVDLERRGVLSRFVPPKVVDEILAGRGDTLVPSRRDVSVLFSDVRDFTTYSESREPEDVLRFLDDYFGRMTQVVQGHDGSVNKFLGDGLLALWGAPTPLDDHPVRAVKAALDMQTVMVELNERRVAGGEMPLHMGIGVHSGEVAAGMLGSGNQSEYSVIGDAVNLASRIEGLTKTHGAGILVSEATWARLGGRFAGERVGEVPVKGRKAAVVLYSITGAIPAALRAP